MSAPHRYFHYQIPKRTGGLRDIYHPTPELKAIQRWLVGTVFVDLPVHQRAFAYVPGRSVADHARQHVKSNYFLKLDFQDFFTSIDAASLREFLLSEQSREIIDLEEDAVDAATRLMCCAVENRQDLRLVIGAPSSPTMTNFFLYEMDRFCHDLASEHQCTFTRYADDIYFSTRAPNVLTIIEDRFRGYLDRAYPILSINEQKVLHTSRKGKVVITGLIITSDRKVSLGRKMKRKIKTKVYLALKGYLDAESASSLSGYLAYVMDAEPDFFEILKRKFGGENVKALM